MKHAADIGVLPVGTVLLAVPRDLMITPDVFADAPYAKAIRAYGRVHSNAFRRGVDGNVMAVFLADEVRRQPTFPSKWGLYLRSLPTDISFLPQHFSQENRDVLKVCRIVGSRCSLYCWFWDPARCGAFLNLAIAAHTT